MAATSVNLPNILQAIKNKDIPGKFDKERLTFSFPTIKYKSKVDGSLEWTIQIKLLKTKDYVPILPEYLNQPVYVLSSNYVAEIIVISKQVGGKIRDSVSTKVTEGKNIDKANATNVITQAFKEAYSMYKNKLRKTNVGSNSKKPLPMLLQTLNSSKQATLTDTDFTNGVTVQRKFNGVRYVTYLDNTDIVQYSRTGKDYYPSDNLVSELLQLLTNAPEVKIGKYGIQTSEEEQAYKQTIPYLDGEFYKHGKSLAYISGQARKETDKDDLDYYVFDIFFPIAIEQGYNMISRYRQEYLTDLFKISKMSRLKHIIRVENFKVKDMHEINELYNRFIKEGYEGAIARKDDQGYKYSFNNYHSPNVLKIKPFYSSEFKIVDFTSGKKGKDANKIIWKCEIENPVDVNDRTFTVVPNLSLENREKLFMCLSKYVDHKTNLFEKYVKGLMLTVEYAEISPKTGKPLQPKGVAIRSYESSIGSSKEDPIKELYRICNIVE